MNISPGKIRFYWCVLFFTLILSQYTGYCEALSLPQLMKKLEATLEWDPVGNLGTIIKGDLRASFKADSPYLLLGDEQLNNTKSAFLQKNGTIIFDEATVSCLTTYFTPVSNPPYPGDLEFTLTSPKIKVILIDPGHGGKDPGTIGKFKTGKETRSLLEKNIVLEVSQHLRDLLMKKYPAKQILLTREKDTYLSLEERIEIANNIKVAKTEAIIFISVHANASFSSAGKGFEVWYLPPQYKRNLIGKEDVEAQNQDLVPILNTMLDAEYTTESILLAKNILAGMDEKVGKLSPNRGLKAEKWFVVHKSKMPSVLIELGFVTNPEEAARLATATYLQALAIGIYNGLNVFIKNFENAKPFSE